MNKKTLFFVSIGLIFYTCNLKSDKKTNKSEQTGILSVETRFYDSAGNVLLLVPMRIWYRDSNVIEEIVRVKSNTDTLNKTTVSYNPEAYKYIDLNRNTWYDYKTFTDTSQIIRSGLLPDSLIPGSKWVGWTFYAKDLRMKGPPVTMPDTMIGVTKYMRIKFKRLSSKTYNNYIIGYLRCDNKTKLFSLEKDYSNKVNCTMTRIYEFKEDALIPFASREIEFLSDTLSQKELKIFDAWRNNQLKFPVK